MAASKEMELAIKIAGKIDSSFNSALSKVSSGIKGATKAMAAGTVAAAAAVGALTVKAINVGREYEQAMSQVQATMLLDTGTAEGAAALQTLEDAARAAGRSTAFSATEAAEALNYLALAGYDADKAAAALPTVLNLAGAGAMDLAAASDMVTDSMSALGIEATQQNLEGFADSMAKTASTSNTSVAQLGEAILTVGGTAKMLKGGGTLEGMTELNTALGLLADNGIKGSEGGTKLRNMITSLTAPTDQAAAALESLGVTAFDESGNMRDLQSIFGDLNTAMDGMSTADRSQILSTIFNKTDLKAVNALLGTSEERWNELSGAVSDCAGACEDMYAIQIDNLNGDLAILKSGLEDLGISVYKDLQPALRSGVQLATDMVGKMADAYEEGGLTGLVSSVGGCLSDAVNVIAEYAPQVVDTAILLVEGFITGIADNAAGIASAGAGVVVSFVSGMFRLVPLVLLTGIDIILSLVSAITQQLPTLITNGTQAIQNFVLGVIQRIPAIITTGLALVRTLVSSIVQNAPSLLASGILLIGSLINGFIQMWPSLVQQGIVLVLGLVQAILQNIPLIIQTGVTILSNFLSGIVQNIQNLVTGGVVLVQMLVNGIVQNLPLILQSGIALVMQLFYGIVQLLPTILTAGVQIIITVAQGIAQALPVILQAAADLIMMLLNGIITYLPTILQAGATLVTNLITGLVQQLPSILTAGMTIILNLVTGILNMLPNLITAGAQLIINLIQGIVENLPMIIQTAIQLIINFVTSITSNLGNIISAGVNIIIALISGILQMIPALIAAIPQIIGGIISAIFETDWLAVGADIVSGIADGFISGFTALVDGVKGLWEDFTGWLFGSGEEAADYIAKDIPGYTETMDGRYTNDNGMTYYTAQELAAQGVAGAAEVAALYEEAGQQAAEAYNQGLAGGGGELSEATQAAIDAGAQGVDLSTWSTMGQEGATNFTEGLDGTLAAYNFNTEGIGVDNSTLTNLLGTAGETGGLAFTEGLDGSLQGYNFDTSSIGVDTSALTATMGESGSVSSEALINGMTQSIANYTVDTSGVTIDTGGITESFQAAGAAGGETITLGLDASLAGYTFDPSSVGLDVSAFTADLTTAASSGGAAFTTSLDSSLAGYSVDASSIGVDTSTLTATLTEGGTAGGQGLIDGLNSAIEAGNFDPATAANIDTSSIMAMMTEAGTGGGEAFTTAIDTSVAGYSFDPASVGIDAGIMTSSMTEAGTAGGQALTQSLTQAIASGTGAVVSAANTLGTGVAQAISSGFERAKSSASSAMASIHGICASGAQRAAAAVKGAFEGMSITIPRPRIPVISVSSSSVSVGDQSVSVPRFSVSWNALGGIFDKPTIFNTPNGMQGVGEAGPEAILPLDTLWAQMREIMTDIIRERDGGGTGIIDGLLQKLQGIGDRKQPGGEMQLAGAGGETINFSPVYNLYGSATQEDAQRAAKTTFEEFKRFMKQYERENKRVRF